MRYYRVNKKKKENKTPADSANPGEVFIGVFKFVQNQQISIGKFTRKLYQMTMA